MRFLPKTGNTEPVDRGKPGCERLRTICARLILAWRRQGERLGTGGCGGYVYLTCSGKRERKRRDTDNKFGDPGHLHPKQHSIDSIDMVYFIFVDFY